MRRVHDLTRQAIQGPIDDLDTRLRRMEFNSEDSGITLTGHDHLAEPAWTDMVVSAASVKLPASAAPAEADWLTSLKTLVFDSGGGEYVHIEGLQFPHGYVKGTDLKWHVHFTTPAAIADGVTVTWQLVYSLATPFSTFPAVATTTSTFTNNAASRAGIAAASLSGTSIVANTHLISESATIPGDGLKASSIISGRMERLAADTLPGDAYFLSADFHYQIDRFGTAGEYKD